MTSLDTTQAERVAAILATYRRATTSDIRTGRDWYPMAGDIARAIATRTGGGDAERVAYVMAALSPRNPWRWNVADAYAYCAAAASGGAQPSATTFKNNRARAWDIATSATLDPWQAAAPKVRAFVRAIMGDRDAVVVDVWSTRVATRGARSEPKRDYAAIADAYRHAAYLAGESPRDLQAITWVVAQREGLGSDRRGRHDLADKRGTPQTVRDILDGWW